MSKDIYSLGIFKGIEEAIIKHILENCPTHSYSAGEIILKEGENSNGEGYIIKSGTVEISIKDENITQLSTSEIFGEIALLNEEERTATVKAISDVETIVLSLDKLIEMINNDSNNINKTIMNRIEDNLER